MITASDSFSTFDLGDYYAILPGDGTVEELYQAAGRDLVAVPQCFAYNSSGNPTFFMWTRSVR
jgi:UDP-N-acetylglucosamine 4,6-dehydratase